jgi:hypothetical protein
MQSFRLREESVAWRAFEGEGTLLHLDRQEIHQLNETGTVLIERLRGGSASAEDLAVELAQTFEVDDETARRDVGSFLDTLRAAELVEVTEQGGR